MFKSGFGATFLVAAVAMSFASGCGTRVGPTGAATPAPTTAPTASPVNPTPIVPTPAPTPTPVPIQPAIATVSNKNTTGGSWYCLGLCHQKVTAQISVTNPNPVEIMADVTVTFTSGGQATGETQQQTLDLPPDGNKSFQAQATQTSDDATAQVTNTEAVGSGAPSAGAAGYGSPYGSPYGGAPGYGSSTGYGGSTGQPGAVAGASSYGGSSYGGSSYGSSSYGQGSSYPSSY